MRVPVSQAEALLEELVCIESPSGEERRAVEFLVGAMRELGLQTAIDEAGNAVGWREGERTGGVGLRDVVLLGHIDTYPGNPPVRRAGDLLYGRGCVDAKGPLAAFVVALANLEEIPAGVRVMVAGAVEEECATSRGARHLAATLRPEACIIGEPSRWDGVTLGYKGRAIVRYALERSCSHSAGPEESVSDSFVRWWHEVARDAAAMTPEAKGVFGRVQAGLRNVNTSGDGLRERIDAAAGFRLPPGVCGEDIEAICRRRAGEALIEVSGMELAHVEPRSSGVVSALSAAIRDGGGVPRQQVKTGTADMNVVAPVWGCPIAAYGPGDSSLDHTPDEHVSMEEFHKAVGVLGRTLAGVDGWLGRGS